MTNIWSLETAELFVSPRKLFGLGPDDRRWLRFLSATGLCAVVSGLLLLPARDHIGIAAGLSPSLALIAASFTVPALLLLMSAGICLSFLLAIGMQYALSLPVKLRDTWTLVNEIAIVKLGVSTLCVGVIVLVSGPAAFSSTHAILNAMPSLAWLFPPASPRIDGILRIVDPFNVWTLALYFIAFRTVWGSSVTKCLLVAFVIAFLPQLLARLVV